MKEFSNEWFEAESYKRIRKLLRRWEKKNKYIDPLTVEGDWEW